MAGHGETHRSQPRVIQRLGKLIDVGTSLLVELGGIRLELDLKIEFRPRDRPRSFAKEFDDVEGSVLHFASTVDLLSELGRSVVARVA